MAIDLTALGLVPNVFDLATPDELHRVRVRTCRSRSKAATATSTDDGEPVGSTSTSAARSSSRRRSQRSFLATRSSRSPSPPPPGVTLDDPNPVLVVPEGSTTSDPVTYEPSRRDYRQDGGYNVWEQLTGDLGRTMGSRQHRVRQRQGHGVDRRRRAADSDHLARRCVLDPRPRDRDVHDHELAGTGRDQRRQGRRRR